MAIIASAVIGLFDATIERLVALAILMPIVASMGGNAGTQTLTVAVRAIALRQLDRDAATAFVRRELLAAALNGVVFAMLSATMAFLWFNNADIAAVMAVAMFANMMIAGLSGTLVPLGLLRLGVDPAVASSVFIATITDVVGFFVFLGLAALYLIYSDLALRDCAAEYFCLFFGPISCPFADCDAMVVSMTVHLKNSLLVQPRSPVCGNGRQSALPRVWN